MDKFNKYQKATNTNGRGFEKRKFERFYLPATVAYSVPGKKQVTGETPARNISLGGIQFRVKEAVEPGSHMTLQIHLSSRTLPTSAEGEVVWVKESHRIVGGFVVGLKFAQVDYFDLHKLLQNALPLFHRDGFC